MVKEPYSHFLSLPPKISKTGQKPSPAHRLWFISIGIFLTFIFANLLISTFTMGVIFPGVSVAGKDLSFKTLAQAREILKSNQNQRSFQVKVGSQVFNANSSDFGVSYDIEKTLDEAYKIGHKTYLPVFGIYDAAKNGQIGYSYNIDQKELRKFTSKIVSSVGKDPVNATLQVSDGNIEVLPDQDGYKVDQKLLTNLIQSSVSEGKDKNLILEPKQVKANFLAKDIDAAKSKAEEILSRSIVLNYEGRQFIADKNAIGHWMYFEHELGNDGKVSLQVRISKEQIMGYLQSIANQTDIAPKNKKINIINGNSSVEQEGSEGKAIIQQPAVDEIFNNLANRNISYDLQSQKIAFKTETNRSVALDYGSYIEVNLSRQRLWAYQDNKVIFTTPVTTGAAGNGFPTVTGLFSIYTKERSRYLNGRPYGWNYNVYVDYWMPFYGGYGLHDADWRSSFGGSDYYYGGSHGCVNMPKSAAAFLYSWSSVGTPVWVHY